MYVSDEELQDLEKRLEDAAASQGALAEELATGGLSLTDQRRQSRQVGRASAYRTAAEWVRNLRLASRTHAHADAPPDTQEEVRSE